MYIRDMFTEHDEGQGLLSPIKGACYKVTQFGDRLVQLTLNMA